MSCLAKPLSAASCVEKLNELITHYPANTDLIVTQKEAQKRSLKSQWTEPPENNIIP
jgi:hypothetical protein